jgi:lipopolysaccharide biosynthesis glycosyltransferase
MHATDGGPIHVALTFDDNFWAPAYATMRSICLASHRRGDLVFHLCHRPLIDEHRADLEKITHEFGAQLFFYDITRSPDFVRTVEGLPYDKRLTNVVYARLLLDRLLPASIERLIYLDCDMMVRAPIETLWATDLEGKTVGAVPDPWGPLFSIGKDMRENGDLYDPADTYFNAGLLLIDMKRWREANLLERIVAFTHEGIMDRIYYDQGFLNIVFRHDLKPLGWRWNFTSPEPMHERFDIAVLHYTGHAKPWKLFARVAFFRLYRHVMTNDLYYRYMRHRVRGRLARMVPFLKK